MYLVLITFTVILAWFLIKSTIKPKNFPPGPTWMPILGSSNSVKAYCKKYGSLHIGLEQMAKDYCTSILGLKLDQQLLIVVFGEDNVKKVLTNNAFDGRPDTYFMRLRSLGSRSGITAADGPLWKVLRQFTLKHLKDVGFGKNSMESEIKSELNAIIDTIKLNGNILHPRTTVAPSVLNVLWKFAAGERIQKNDQRLNKLLNIMDTRSKAFAMSGNILNEFPWIRYIAPNLSGYNLIKTMNDELSQFIKEAINNHKEGKLKEQDFIYEFLEAMKTDESIYTEQQLIVICLDLFIAGSQTTSASIDFAILMMILNKDMQQKVHNEIDSVIGARQPKWEDITSLPYVNAVLMEVQRFFTIVPLIGPRRTLEEVEFNSYTIPKDVTVLMSTHSVHHDVNIWSDPYKFRPERYLENGQSLSRHMYHFGLGHRRCLGEVLARYCMFILFTGIMQRFHVKQNGDCRPSCIPIPGITLSAPHYLACFVERHH